MNNLLLFGSFHRAADEPREPSPVYTSEPLPILADGSFGELCAICDAFGKLCCKLHRSCIVKDIPDEGAPPIRFDRGGGDR